jgi:DNA helicase II / ATP-dependent DNA helicase PcrA
MKILLAGPGTGKTTNISKIIQEKKSLDSVLVISFTNATVEDLKKSLSSIGLPIENCMTLHKFAVKYNHDRSRHVLETMETTKLFRIAKATGISFNALCDFLSATTFDQMIGRFVAYAKSNPEYLKGKLSKYSVLIVDEYQDFNKNEQELIDLLVGIINETYILGDDDQCIYDFKDADNEKIISLHSDTSHEKIEHEHKCYRCPDDVVDSATKLIQKNTKRVDKKWEKTGKEGNLIQKQFLSNTNTADYILEEVQKILKNNQDDKILILTPVRFLIESITDRLDSSEIEYRNYLVAKVDPELIVKSWVLRMLFGRHKYLNLMLIGYNVLSTRKKFYETIIKQYASGQDFSELFNVVTSKIPDEGKNTYKSVDTALQDPYFQGLTDFFNNAEGDIEDEKLENLFVLVDENVEKRVNIMSIHKSKGLGAEHVFMIGLIEGIIPNRAKGNDTVESQRRLFYVGMTRAKKDLHLISSIDLEGKYVNTVNKEDFKFDFRSRLWKGKASRFIEEINAQ